MNPPATLNIRLVPSEMSATCSPVVQSSPINDRYDPVFADMRASKLKHLRSVNREDAVTWNVFRSLRQVAPATWLPLLGSGHLGAYRFLLTYRQRSLCGAASNRPLACSPAETRATRKSMSSSKPPRGSGSLKRSIEVTSRQEPRHGPSGIRFSGTWTLAHTTRASGSSSSPS